MKLGHFPAVTLGLTLCVLACGSAGEGGASAPLAGSASVNDAGAGAGAAGAGTPSGGADAGGAAAGASGGPSAGATSGGGVSGPGGAGGASGAAGAGGTSPQSIQPYAGTPVTGYVLDWSDEFDGQSLDTTKWLHRTDSKHWSTQLPANVSVAGGMLHLALKKENAGGKSVSACPPARLRSPPTFTCTRASSRRLPSSTSWTEPWCRW